MSSHLKKDKPFLALLCCFVTALLFFLSASVPAAAANGSPLNVRVEHVYPGVGAQPAQDKAVAEGSVVNLLDWRQSIYNNTSYHLQSIKVERRALTPIEYTVIYDASGGVGAYTDTVATGQSYAVKALSATGISRTGYSFVEWNTEPDGSGTNYAPGNSITVTGDMTLYAQWKAAKATVVLVCIDVETNTVLQEISHIVDSGSYGPYAPPYIGDYVFIGVGGASDPIVGTIGPNETKTLIYEYVKAGVDYLGMSFRSGSYSLANTDTEQYAQVSGIEGFVLPTAAPGAGWTIDMTWNQNSADSTYNFAGGYEYWVTYTYRAADNGGGTPTPPHSSGDTTIGGQPVPLDQLPALTDIPDNEVPLASSPQTGAANPSLPRVLLALGPLLALGAGLVLKLRKND